MSRNIEFIKAIKHWMIDQDYNQSDLAEFIGCSKAFASAALTGRKAIPENWLYKLPVEVTRETIEEKIANSKRYIGKLEGLLK